MPSRWGAARVYDLGASKGGEWWRLGKETTNYSGEFIWEGFRFSSAEVCVGWGDVGENERGGAFGAEDLGYGRCGPISSYVMASVLGRKAQV